MRAWILIAALAAPLAAQDGGPGAPPNADGTDAPTKQPAPAPKPEPAPAPKPEPKPILHRVLLKSGTVLVGRIAPDVWEITTHYGALRVPTRDVRRVVFGRAADPEMRAKVERWIGMLVHEDPAHRKRAIAALRREAAFAFAILEAAAKKHDNPAVKKACADIVDDLNIDEDDMLDESDTIETKSFTFVGTVEPRSFQVRVGELGGLNVRRSDIRTIRILDDDEEQSDKIEVTADHNHRLGWLETKVKLRKGQRFRIRAGGTIHFTQYGANGMCTPQHGAPRMGTYNNYTVGTLLAKVGNGPYFPVGADYKGKANEAGVLKLAINSGYNRSMRHTGAYEIRVTLR